MPGTVTQTFNTRRQRQVHLYEFWANMVYIVSSKPTYEGCIVRPCLKRTKIKM